MMARRSVFGGLFGDYGTGMGEADRAYDPSRYLTDAATVRSVQAALTSQAKQRSDPGLDPKGIDGIFGPNTRAAVQHFNAVYRGWPDEQGITEGTLEALRYAGLLKPVAPVPATPSNPFAGSSASGAASSSGSSGSSSRSRPAAPSDTSGLLVAGLAAGGMLAAMLLKKKGKHA